MATRDEWQQDYVGPFLVATNNEPFATELMLRMTARLTYDRDRLEDRRWTEDIEKVTKEFEYPLATTVNHWDEFTSGRHQWDSEGLLVFLRDKCKQHVELAPFINLAVYVGERRLYPAPMRAVFKTLNLQMKMWFDLTGYRPVYDYQLLLSAP